jgi:hypothetical protein
VLKSGHRKPNGMKIVTKSIGHALSLKPVQLLRSLTMPIMIVMSMSGPRILVFDSNDGAEDIPNNWWCGA